MPSQGAPKGPPKLSTLHISHIASSEAAENLHNQLEALLQRASPILKDLIKTKDTSFTDRLAGYFDTPATAHWAVLFPKARTQVKEPSVTEAAEFKRLSGNLAHLTRQVQSLSSRFAAQSTNQPQPGAPRSFAAVAASGHAKHPTSQKSTPPAQPAGPTERPRVVLRYPNSSAPLDPPIALLHRFNSTLQSLGHNVTLSAVHRTSKGNLVLTAAPETKQEALWAAKPALQNIAPSMTGAPVLAYRDVRWSRVMLHSVYTGKNAQSAPHSPLDIHSELIAHNPVYRELIITQQPSWVRAPGSLENHSRSSVAFSFEDPDGKLLAHVVRQKGFFLFGDRSPIKSWKKKKPEPKKPSTITISDPNPFATGSNKAKIRNPRAPALPTTASNSGKQPENTTTGHAGLPKRPTSTPQTATQSRAATDTLMEDIMNSQLQRMQVVESGPPDHPVLEYADIPKDDGDSDYEDDNGDMSE